MSSRKLYAISTIIEIITIIIIFTAVKLILIEIFVSPEIDLYFWNVLCLVLDCCIAACFLLKDYLVLNMGAKLMKIAYIPTLTFKAVISKNALAFLACCFWLIPEDIYVLIHPLSKTPVWILYLELYLPMFLLGIDFYWNVSLRLSGLRLTNTSGGR